MPRTIRKAMIVKSDGECRIVSMPLRRKLCIDEIAVPIEVTIPDAWGRMQKEAVVIEMPEPPIALLANDS